MAKKQVTIERRGVIAINPATHEVQLNPTEMKP